MNKQVNKLLKYKVDLGNLCDCLIIVNFFGKTSNS